MNQITLNLIAIGIFSVVLMILVGPLISLSPTVPAIIGLIVLLLATLDTFAFQGRLGDLLIDAIAQQDPDYRLRIRRHEAGHFLVAQLLDVSVTDYTLSAWEALRKGQAGRGGVNVDLQAMVQEAERGVLSSQSLDTYCTVWMAGIAAEQLIYGQAEGGASDRAQIKRLWSRLNVPPQGVDLKIRWATLQAKTLLERHRDLHNELVDKLDHRVDVQDCIQHITATINSTKTETVQSAPA